MPGTAVRPARGACSRKPLVFASWYDRLPTKPKCWFCSTRINTARRQAKNSVWLLHLSLRNARWSSANASRPKHCRDCSIAPGRSLGSLARTYRLPPLYWPRGRRQMRRCDWSCSTRRGADRASCLGRAFALVTAHASPDPVSRDSRVTACRPAIDTRGHHAGAGAAGEPAFRPCTAAGRLRLLRRLRGGEAAAADGPGQPQALHWIGTLPARS